jgi:O-antigen/teichoic acid export membrane protein
MNTQSREVNSIRNIIVGVINQVSILFLNIVATTLFIKKLGIEYLGINGLFSNLFIVLSFAEFGIGTVMIYSLYGPLAKGDTKKITCIYRFFEKIYIIMSLLSALIGILLIPMLKYIVNTELAINNIVLYYLLFLFSMVIFNMLAYKSNLIIADQKRYIVGLYRFFFNSIAVIFQIIYLMITMNFTHYLIIVLVKNIVYNFAVSRKVNLIYPFIKDKDNYNNISQKEKKQILKKVREVFSYNFAQSLLTGTDNIIISTLVGTAWVGYYSNYNAIIVGVLGLVDSIYIAISASIGNLIAEQKVENQFRLFKTTEVINFWITGFTTTCLYILLQDFIILWIGKKYLFDLKILIVLLLNYYLVCTMNSIRVFRAASGMFEKVKHVMILAAAMNIFLSILMGRIFGVFGILLATSITALSTYYWYEAKLLLENKFGCSVKIYFKGQIKSFSLTIMSIFITSLCVSRINQVTISSFIIKLGICLVVPNIFYFMVLKREEEFQEVFVMVIRNLKKLTNKRKNI